MLPTKASLTDSNITAATTGVTLLQAGSGTLNNVTINAGQTGVWAMQSSLDLTGGSITLNGGQSTGIALMAGTATVSGVIFIQRRSARAW
jgi:hypothetical protein